MAQQSIRKDIENFLRTGAYPKAAVFNSDPIISPATVRVTVGNPRRSITDVDQLLSPDTATAVQKGLYNYIVKVSPDLKRYPMIRSTILAHELAEGTYLANAIAKQRLARAYGFDRMRPEAALAGFIVGPGHRAGMMHEFYAAKRLGMAKKYSSFATHMRGYAASTSTLGEVLPSLIALSHRGVLPEGNVRSLAQRALRNYDRFSAFQERFMPAFARDSLQSGVKYIRDYTSGTIDEIDRMILHQTGANNLKFIETPYFENKLKEIRATRLGLKRYGKPPSPQTPGVQAMMLFEEAFDMLKRGYGVLQAQQGQAAQTGSIKKTSKVTKPVNPIPSPEPQSPSLRNLIRRILRKR